MPAQLRQSLPEPDPASRAHSERVLEHLRQLIGARGGDIGFDDYMQAVLYAPGLGYYSAGATKFAADGDFVTAPELGSLFAGVLARQCAPVLAATGGEIVEYGAGTGRLAADLLNALAELDALPERYRIVEVSADLRARQQQTLESCVGDLASRVSWLDAPPDEPWDGVLIANEVLDALPVARFRLTGGRVEAQCVGLDGDELCSVWRPADPALHDAVGQLQAALGRSLPDDYESEYCRMLEAWLGEATLGLRRGVALFSDYGYGRDQFYAPERRRGTLTCHYRHHMHDDPLLLPGIQDVTAWVDFSRVAEALDAAGFGYLGFTTQAQFLLAGGLADVLGDTPDVATTREAKTLTLPGGMGEAFKVLGFARDCAPSLPAFSGRDFGRLL